MLLVDAGQMEPERVAAAIRFRSEVLLAFDRLVGGEVI